LIGWPAAWPRCSRAQIKRSTILEPVAASRENTEGAMTAEDNKATFLRFVSELNRGNLRIIDEVCSPTFAFYSPSKPDWPHGLEGARKIITTAVAAIPDLQSKISSRKGIRSPFAGPSVAPIREKPCPAIQNRGNASLRAPSVFIASSTAGSRKTGASESFRRRHPVGGDVRINLCHFGPLDVPAHDPFVALPQG
jgi:hypothetical protein